MFILLSLWLDNYAHICLFKWRLSFMNDTLFCNWRAYSKSLTQSYWIIFKHFNYIQSISIRKTLPIKISNISSGITHCHCFYEKLNDKCNKYYLFNTCTILESSLSTRSSKGGISGTWISHCQRMRDYWNSTHLN